MTETATRLLDAVDEVIERHGPSGVTLRRVGEAAGVSHTAAAHYYRDKPGLMTAYMTRTWNRVGDVLEAAAQANDPRTAILHAARAYASLAVESRSAFIVMNRLELAHAEDPALSHARERGFSTLARIVQRAQDAGWAASRDPLDLLSTLWGLVHGVTDLWLGGPLRSPYDGVELPAVIERVVGGLLDALEGSPRVE